MTRTRKRPSHSCRNRAFFISCAPSRQATRGVATQRFIRDPCPLQTLRNYEPLPLDLRPVQSWTIPSGLPLGLRSFIWPGGTTSSRSFLWHTNQFARNFPYFSAPSTRRHPLLSERRSRRSRHAGRSASPFAASMIRRPGRTRWSNVGPWPNRHRSRVSPRTHFACGRHERARPGAEERPVFDAGHIGGRSTVIYVGEKFPTRQEERQ
jgi:hypothetical protein